MKRIFFYERGEIIAEGILPQDLPINLQRHLTVKNAFFCQTCGEIWLRTIPLPCNYNYWELNTNNPCPAHNETPNYIYKNADLENLIPFLPREILAHEFLRREAWIEERYNLENSKR